MGNGGGCCAVCLFFFLRHPLGIAYTVSRESRGHKWEFFFVERVGEERACRVREWEWERTKKKGGGGGGVGKGIVPPLPFPLASLQSPLLCFFLYCNVYIFFASRFFCCFVFFFTAFFSSRRNEGQRGYPQASVGVKVRMNGRQDNLSMKPHESTPSLAFPYVRWQKRVRGGGVKIIPLALPSRKECPARRRSVLPRRCAAACTRRGLS